MKTLQHICLTLWTATLSRWQRARTDDRGAVFTDYSATTALAIAGAITIVGIIVAVATGWAHSIPGAGG
jgi:hypothetical protein